MTTFSKQAELDFMHNFRHDTEGDRWAKHEIESLRAENMELKNNITICSVRIKELSQQVTLLREALETISDVFANIAITSGAYEDELAALDKANAALAQPTDYSALREIKAGYEAQLNVMREALENCRLIAARHRKEEWAQHTLRICAEAGVTGSPLRQEDDDSALREMLAAERERCAKVAAKIGGYTE